MKRSIKYRKIRALSTVAVRYDDNETYGYTLKKLLHSVEYKKYYGIYWKLWYEEALKEYFAGYNSWAERQKKVIW